MSGERADDARLKQALITIKTLKSKLAALEAAAREPIAVIGLGCRFPPDADHPEAFWHLLRDGVDAITEVPPERFDVEAHFDSDPEAVGKTSTRRGGFLKRIDRFEPEFFGIAPREVETLDPQQRLLLEVGWEALEDAAQPVDRLAGRAIGLFVGMSNFDYYVEMSHRGPGAAAAYLGTGTSHSAAAARLAYLFDFRGPALAVDTACSSSLVAVHLACQSLRRRECETALAGGVCLHLRPELFINLSQARMLAPDGRCKTFDAAADGFVRGEGCGMVVLKRLADAQRAGDRILALIRGTAVNQDGRTQGFTAPSGPAQQEVQRRALAEAGVEPKEVGYLETHGTGTALGDSTEVQALASVYGADRDAGRPLWIGSLKTNIGHLEAAAGIAALIKVVLILTHKELPPHLHLRQPNPHIPWDELPLRIPTRRVPWTAGGRRIAGVSSFGFSGTNAHAVIEDSDAVPRPAPACERPLHLLTLSARTKPALLESAQRLSRHLQSHPEIALADAAFTANAGRSHFSHRCAVIAEDRAEATEKLSARGRGEEVRDGVASTADETREPRLAFLFTGQGALYAGTGRELYATQPTFRRTLERCDELLRPRLGESLLPLIEDDAGSEDRLGRTSWAQPAIFALEVALVELWRSWGVEPTAVLGHSLGEYVAAWAAGVIGLEEGLELIAERGRLMQERTGEGVMAVVFAAPEQVERTLMDQDEVAIAAINAPRSLVISGPPEALREKIGRLYAEGIKSKPIAVSRAFHSPLMEPMLDELERAASAVSYAPPRIRLISNLTGEAVGGDEIDGSFWRRHSRQPVLFSQGLAALMRAGYECFLEIGPHSTLCGLGQLSFPDAGASWLPSLKRGRGEWPQMLSSLAELYVRGVRVDWEGFDRDTPRRKVALPTYPFQRRRYWPQPAGSIPRTAVAVLSPQRIAEPAFAGAFDLGSRHGLDAYSEILVETEAWSAGYVARALQDLGFTLRPGARLSRAELGRRIGPEVWKRRLLRRLLGMLVDDGLLIEATDEVWEVVGSPPVLETTARFQALAESHPGNEAQLTLLRRCGERLSAVLRGSQDPLELLFGEGLVERLYQEMPVSRVFNLLIQNVLSHALAHWPDGRRLRVLEIGAGTGSTTSAVLPAVSAQRTEYVFTDVGPLFLTRAGERFRDVSFLRCARLDIDKDPLAQGFQRHRYDVVVAANVLHATPDLDRTMSHVRALLASRGLLVLLEGVGVQRWLDLTFGLLPGWWQFTDTERRPASALLSWPRWRDLLRDHGFSEVTSSPLGEGAGVLEACQQAIILARGPRVERLREEDAGQTGTVPAKAASRSGTARRESASRGELRQRLLKKVPPPRWREILSEDIRRRAASVLGLEVSAVDPRQDLNRLGLDSLMAVELRNAISVAVDCELPATLLFDRPTIEAVAAYLEAEVLDAKPERVRPTRRPPEPASPAASEDVRTLLDEELAALESEIGRAADE